MDWRDYVLVGDIKDFLEREKAYCRLETEHFHQTEGKTKEIARAMVLAKRLKFLASWIADH